MKKILIPLILSASTLLSFAQGVKQSGWTTTTDPETARTALGAPGPNGIANAEARAFISKNFIYNRTSQTELDECISEMKTGYGSPYFSNVVSCLALEPKFGTNGNIVGNSPQWSGPIIQIPQAVNFSGNSTCTVPVNITEDFTLTVWFRFTQTNFSTWQGRGSGSPIIILKDTNGLSADALCVSPSGNELDSETNGGAIITRPIYRSQIGSYDSAAFVQQLNCITLVRAGQSNYLYWNSAPASFTNTARFSTTAINTNVINAVILGGDPLITTVRSETLQVMAYSLANVALSTNQVGSMYKATAWLLEGNCFDFFACDSRGAIGTIANAGFNYYNDWPFWYFQANPQRYFFNVSEGSQTSRNYTNWAMQPYAWAPVTNLPSKKFNDCWLNCNFGINDFYINSMLPTEVISNIITAESAPKAWGSKINDVDVYDIATNNINWNYSLTIYTNIQVRNGMARTNAFFDYQTPQGEVTSQGMLATNGTYRLCNDGVHFGPGTTNSVVPMLFSSMYRIPSKPVGSPWSPWCYSFVPVFTNLPTSGNTIRIDPYGNWYYGN